MIALLFGNRMEMVQRAAAKFTAYFVFVVVIMAEFFMAKLEFMVEWHSSKPDEGQ